MPWDWEEDIYGNAALPEFTLWVTSNTGARQNKPLQRFYGNRVEIESLFNKENITTVQKRKTMVLIEEILLEWNVYHRASLLLIKYIISNIIFSWSVL